MRFRLRKEKFGGILFDRRFLNFIYLSKEEIAKSNLRINGEIVTEFQRITAHGENIPDHLLSSPIRVYFELTRECQLRCKTCFNSSGKSLVDEMSTKDILKTVEGLANDGVMEIRYSGGELTQRDDWDNILRRSIDLGLGTSINTNGVYTDRKTVEILASLGLDQVTVSIDGAKKVHDFIRGKGMFDKAIATLADLKTENVPLRVNSVLTKGSAKDMPEILEKVAPFVEEINFFYMRSAGRALEILDQSMSFEDMYQFDLEIEKYKSLYPHMRILHGSKVMVNNSISQQNSKDNNLRMGGPDGFTRLNILPNGDVWPGGYTPYIAPEYFLGKVQDNNFSILTIWRTNKTLEAFREYSFSVQNICVACPEKNVRCPGASVEMELYRKKSADKKNPYCIF